MRNNSSRASLVVGLALVGLGLLFLLQQFFDFDFFGTLWPLLVIGVGGLLFVSALAGGPGSAPLFVPASIVTMVGLILFTLNLTDRWEAWSYAWTLILVAVGVGLTLHGARSRNPELRRRGIQTIQTGLVLLLVFGAFFELVIFGSAREASWAGPALLIVAGLFLLARSVIRGRRPEIEPAKERQKEAGQAPQ